MTLKTVYVSAGFLAGLYVCFIANDLVMWSLAFIVLVAVFSFLLGKNIRVKVILTAVSFAAAVLTFVVYTYFRISPLEDFEGESVSFKGKVIAMDESDRGAVTVKGEIDGIPCKAIMYLSGFSGDLCYDVEFSAEAKKLSSDGFFDERATYYPDGIYLRLIPDGTILCDKPTEYGIDDMLRLYSRYCSERIREYVGGDEGDLITAMSTGDDIRMDDSLRRILNRTGIGHVTSVSGLHVSITAAFVLVIFKKLNLRYSLCCLGAMIPVAAYVIFTGGEVSAIRSAIMMSVYILATLSRRRTHPLNTLALCALVMALFNPYVAADASFVLSLSGVFAVSVISPWVNKALNIRSKLGKALALSVSAWLGTMPALMLYFDEVSLLSPIMNLTLPLCSAALILTLIFVILGCNPILSFLPKLAGLLVKPIIHLSSWLSDFEFACIPVFEEYIAVIASFIMLALLVAFLLLKSNKSSLTFAALAIALFFGIYGMTFAKHQSKLNISVIYSGDEAMCVLHKSDECIIIDVNKADGLLWEAEGYLTRNGVDRILLATSNKNGESSYSAYQRFPIDNKLLYLPKDTYIFEPNIPIDYLGEQTVIRFADCDIIISKNGVHITRGGHTYSIAYGLASDADTEISVFDGVAVVNGQIYPEEGIITIVSE